MNKPSDAGDSSRVSRRQVLTATAGIGMTGLAGCTDRLLDRAGQLGGTNAVTNEGAFPALLFGGDSRPDRTLIDSGYTYEELEITVSGEVKGVESSIDLYGDSIRSVVTAENHNATRTDRMGDVRASDADSGSLERARAVYDYLDGEATVGERFVITLPDARLRDSDAALASRVTPPRLLRSTTGETIGRVTDDDGTVFDWESAVPRLSAQITHPWPPLGTTGPFNPHETVLAAGGTDGTDSPTVALGPLLNPDRNGSESDGVAIANGAVTPFRWDERESWGTETRGGAARVTPMLLASVSAQPDGCPEPMPALLFVQRIRHQGQCLYVGGWTIDDNALYEDAVTILATDGAPTVVSLHIEESDKDDTETLRRAVLSGLDTDRCDDRCRLGSVTYDGELGTDGTLSESVEQFMPRTFRDGRKRRLLTNDVWESAGGREQRESVQGMVVPLTPPIVHVDSPAAVFCRPCDGYWYCWYPCPRTTNLVPAVNNISSR